MEKGWREPWAELRRRSHLVFGLAPLPDGVDGVYWPGRRARAAVILDCDLGRVERRCALAHELKHDERGGGVCVEGMPEMYGVVASREEARVARAAAGALVPAHELRAFIEARVNDEVCGVTLQEVAEEFDVTQAVARRAIELLASAV